jgi:hypothetical protein
MPQFATSTGAQVAVPQNRLRKSIVFTNIDTTDSIFLENTNVGTITASNAGIRLRPGDSIAFNDLIDGDAQITDRWQCIASANTPTLLWFETETVQR